MLTRGLPKLSHHHHMCLHWAAHAAAVGQWWEQGEVHSAEAPAPAPHGMGLWLQESSAHPDRTGAEVLCSLPWEAVSGSKGLDVSPLTLTIICSTGQDNQSFTRCWLERASPPPWHRLRADFSSMVPAHTSCACWWNKSKQYSLLS